MDRNFFKLDFLRFLFFSLFGFSQCNSSVLIVKVGSSNVKRICPRHRYLTTRVYCQFWNNPFQYFLTITVVECCIWVEQCGLYIDNGDEQTWFLCLRHHISKCGDAGEIWALPVAAGTSCQSNRSLSPNGHLIFSHIILIIVVSNMYMT